jgi:glycine betaine/proline transport system permease protein
VKLIEGLTANHAYERQYLRWRADPTVPHGATTISAAFGALLLIGIWPLTIYRFTISKPWALITEFPVKKELFSPVANWLEAGFDWMAIEFGDVFKGITGLIRAILDGLELLLVGTPWPVVMLVIIVTAFRLAGPRVAVFVTAALAYIACFGLWEASMVTVALLGAAAFLCLLFGIPLGLWFGKSKRAYAAALPVLDFMQTMPAFVYLIPIIAFFGTGKPPGVLATIVFAMPPVIRLTALGMHQVPEGTKEAATSRSRSPCLPS